MRIFSSIPDLSLEELQKCSDPHCIVLVAIPDSTCESHTLANPSRLSPRKRVLRGIADSETIDFLLSAIFKTALRVFKFQSLTTPSDDLSI